MKKLMKNKKVWIAVAVVVIVAWYMFGGHVPANAVQQFNNIKIYEGRYGALYSSPQKKFLSV